MAKRRFLNPDYLSRPLVPFPSPSLTPLRSYSMMKPVGDSDSGEGNGFKSYLNTVALAKFAAISKARWDPQGPFKKSHAINSFIPSTFCRHFRSHPYSSRAFEGLEVLDVVGCGDGSHSEASDPLISSMDSFSIAGYNPSSTYTEKLKLVQLFEQWMEEHEKSYAQPEDKIHAFQNFIKNYELCKQCNANAQKNGGHFCGLNSFSDLSTEEFNKIYSNYKLGEEFARRYKLGCERNDDSCSAPPSLNWEDKCLVTPLKDEGQYGNNAGLEAGLAQHSGN